MQLCSFLHSLISAPHRAQNWRGKDHQSIQPTAVQFCDTHSRPTLPRQIQISSRSEIFCFWYTLIDLCIENALHTCYRTCLELMKESKQNSIAFPLINSEKRGYANEEASHIAIRM